MVYMVIKNFYSYLNIILIIFFSTLPGVASPFEYKYSKNWKYVYHKHNESSYQHAYCSKVGGIEEYLLPDKTRVDCLTETHAIEFDFANKKYEAVGQALHYAIMTGKKPGIVLILDKDYFDKQIYYYNRLVKIGEIYDIKVDYVTEDILNLNKEQMCSYKDCKCHKKKK